MNPALIIPILLFLLLCRIAQSKDRKGLYIIREIEDLRYLVHPIPLGSDAQPYAAKTEGILSSSVVLFFL